MDFTSALRLVAEAHEREIRFARRESPAPRGLHSSGGKLSVESALPFSPCVSTPLDSTCIPSDSHQIPLGLVQSLLRTPSTTKTVGVGGVPYTPRELAGSRNLKKTPAELIREDKQNACGLLKGSAHYLHVSSETSLTPRGSSDGLKELQSGTSLDKLPYDCSFDGPMTIPERWQALAEGIVCQHAVQMVLHKGWHIEGLKDSLKVGSRHTFNVAPSASTNTTRKSNKTVLSEAQKAAVSKLEARCARFGATDVITVPVPVARKTHVKGFSFFRRSTYSSFRRGSRGSRESQNYNRFVMHPAASHRQLWYVMCLIVIAFEVFLVTMHPFSIMDDILYERIEWCTAAFWTIDIVFSFFSGRYLNGRLEMRLGVVSFVYIRTWFSFDLSLTLMQYLAIFVDTTGDHEDLVLQIMRHLRPVRLVKVMFVQHAELVIFNTNTIAASKLFRFLALLGFFCHCSACLWFEIGKADNGWVGVYTDNLGATSGQSYLVALHWSLSQLQGSIDVFPTSLSDRIYICCSSFLSIVVLTLFVSSMTDTLVNARQLRKQKLEEEGLLKNFFSRHDIDPEIRARCDHFLQIKEKQKHVLEDNESDLRTLELFPASVRSLLLSEMWSFSLQWHPAFAYLQRYHRNVFVNVISTAIDLHTYAPNDDVFTVGLITKTAYVVYTGDFVLNASFDVVSTLAPWLQEDTNKQERLKAKFAKQTKSSLRDSQSCLTLCSDASSLSGDDKFIKQHRPVRKLTKGQVVSEISLWVEWMHAGDLCAVDHGQCFSINAIQVIEVLIQHPGAHTIFASYAFRLLQAANQLRQMNQSLELMSFIQVLEVEDEGRRNNSEHSESKTKSFLGLFSSSMVYE